MELASAFDYSGFSSASARQLQEAAEQIRKSARATVFSIGATLSEVKRLLPHGQFGVWVEDECGLSHRRANEMMQVAECFQNADPKVIERIASRALVDLSAETCPLEALEECVRLAHAGEYVTYTRSRELIDEFKMAQCATLPTENLEEITTPQEDAPEQRLLPDHDDQDEQEVRSVTAELVDDDEMEPQDVEYEVVEDDDRNTDEDQDSADEGISYVARFRSLWREADDQGRLAICLEVIGYEEMAPYLEPPKPKRGSSGLPEELPSVLDTDEFREAWADWYGQRKKGLQAKAVQRKLAEFSDWGHDVAVQALREAFENGYTGVFKPKGLDSRNADAVNETIKAGQNWLSRSEN